jgi:hypothetical protein
MTARTTFLRRLGLGCALSAAALLPPASQAATLFGVRVGEYTDIGEPFAGVELNTEMRKDIWFNPNLEYVFVDRGRLVTLNLDLHYDFDVDAPLQVWAGGGPALILRDRDLPRDDDSETDFGLNLLGGVGFAAGGLLPYAQLKAILSDENEVVVAFGVRF